MRSVTLWLAFFLSVFVHADTPSFSYSPTSSTLTIIHHECLDGRGIKDTLAEHQFQKFHNYISQNHQNIILSINENEQLNDKEITMMLAMLHLGIKKESFKHQFNFIGNDTCTDASANIAIDTNVNLASFFSFPTPDTIHFVSSTEQLDITLKQHLNNHGIRFYKPILSTFLTNVAQYQQNKRQLTYYQFDLKAYSSSLSQKTKIVAIKGNVNFTTYLSQYLLNKGFTIVQDEEDAYFVVSIQGEIEENNYLSLFLEISRKEQATVTLQNNSRALPKVDLSNPAIINKYSQIHLELLQLGDKLVQLQSSK